MTAFGEMTTSFTLLSLAIVCQALSGVPLLFWKASRGAQRLCATLLVAGSLSGAGGALCVLYSPTSLTFEIISGLPFGAALIGADPLSAIFLLPMFVVTGCSALYGLGYWPADRHRRNVGRLSFFLGLLSAALTTLLLARNTVLFLAAWEVMAFAAFFALTTEDEKPEVREAGILYLITTHVGTLALFAMFSLLKSSTGVYLFPAQGSLAGQTATATAIFLTALIGFGLKAGIMPLHVWLPSAHANAPSHVSAILSGIVLKTGVYGMVRIFSAFSEVPMWWGVTVLLIGGISGIVGVAFAIGQHDLKRLLAYHSIENVGIIMLGLGVALVGQSEGNPVLVALGMGGALLHVVNHATFKGLLFLAAGSVIHAAHTREIDLLGGVGRRLPFTSSFFLIGAVAICGLPPLNGFVSELLVYLGSFFAIRSYGSLAGVFPALAAPVLALIGGLAVACFVKVFGVVFLGVPRSPEHAKGQEAPLTMLVPMAVLAALCALIGVAPVLISSPLNSAVVGYDRAVAASPGLGALVPFKVLTVLGGGLLAVIALLALYMIRRGRTLPQAASVTWGCGYLRPTPRMQYSSSSFGSMLVHWFRLVLRPQEHGKEVTGLFPLESRFESHVPETVLERIYYPILEYLYMKSAPIRRLQHGKLNIYIFYTFITLVLLMVLTTR